MRSRSDENDEDEARRSSAVLGLIVILSLAIAGVTIVRDLRQKALIEDCLMAGRTNCVPIEMPNTPN